MSSSAADEPAPRTRPSRTHGSTELMSMSEGVRKRKGGPAEGDAQDGAGVSASSSAGAAAPAPGLLRMASPRMWVLIITACVCFLIGSYFLADGHVARRGDAGGKSKQPGVFTKEAAKWSAEEGSLELHPTAYGGAGVRLVTRAELAEHHAGAKVIWLSILGQVFDVTKGARFYATGNGYDGFSGTDGSRAFLSGEFNPKGLVDTIDGLDHKELDGLNGWRNFYHTDYSFVGNLAGGNFYEEDGTPRAPVHAVKEGLALSAAEEVRRKEEERLRPSCNTRWAQVGAADSPPTHTLGFRFRV